MSQKAGLARAGRADDAGVEVAGVGRDFAAGCSWSRHSVPVRMHIVFKLGVNKWLDVCFVYPMKRFVKCFFELLTQIIVKVRKCKAQRVCVLHFQLAGSGGCFFLMKLYH